MADIAEKMEKAVVGITNRSEVTVPDFFFYDRSRTQDVEVTVRESKQGRTCPDQPSRIAGQNSFCHPIRRRKG